MHPVLASILLSWSLALAGEDPPASRPDPVRLEPAPVREADPGEESDVHEFLPPSGNRLFPSVPTLEALFPSWPGRRTVGDLNLGGSGATERIANAWELWIQGDPQSPLAHLALAPWNPAEYASAGRGVELAPSGFDFSEWNGLRYDGMQHVANVRAERDWAALSAKTVLRGGDDLLDPSRRNAWETDETVKMPVFGSLFVFGQMGASSAWVEQQQLKYLGKTGVGMKLNTGLLPEVQLRGGPAMRYQDEGGVVRGSATDRSEVFLEAVTKLPVPVIGPLNFEYTSYAVPAASSTDHSQINQDFKFALPLSRGQFHLGAKYRWEATPSATPWIDRMQLYMGLQLKR